MKHILRVKHGSNNEKNLVIIELVSYSHMYEAQFNINIMIITWKIKIINKQHEIIYNVYCIRS